MTKDTCYSGRFLNKVMIITGAATGIGRATALRAAKEQAMQFVKNKMAQALANDIPKEKAMSMAGDKMQNIQHRNALPEEQAASMLFLASDDATHLTGTLFATDGGWTAF